MVPFASRRVTLLAMSSFALALFMIDFTTHWLDPVRAGFSRLFLPFIELASLPKLSVEQVDLMLKTKQELIQDIANLEALAVGRAFKLQRYTQLEAENQHLRDVLQLESVQTGELIVSQVLLLRITSLSHKLVIDKGALHGVVKNAIVLDSDGVVGQVHSVSRNHSWVTLMSDPEHSVPVELSRTGVRGILQGMGDLNVLDMSYIPETADVQQGDIVVTSGLGGRFPMGYPLARIRDVSWGGHHQFARIHAVPQARLSKLRFLMVMPPTDMDQYHEEDSDHG